MNKKTMWLNILFSLICIYLIILFVKYSDTFGLVNIIMTCIAWYSLYLSFLFNKEIIIEHDNLPDKRNVKLPHMFFMHIFWFIGFSNVYFWYVWVLFHI
jgi:hypothetical protein